MLRRPLFLLGGAALVFFPVVVLPQVLSVDPLAARPGEEHALIVRFAAEGTESVALQFDIHFSGPFVIRPLAVGRPDCRLIPSVERSGTVFVFIPAGCTLEVEPVCEGTRVLIFDFFDRSPLPDGPLLSCTLLVSASATDGEYPIAIRNVAVSDATGRLLANARGVDGTLAVSQAVPRPTFTPTPLPTPSPTPPACIGDCNGDFTVTIEELVAMVGNALGERDMDCEVADPNRDGIVTVEEIVAAVNFALHGCSVTAQGNLVVPAVTDRLG